MSTYSSVQTYCICRCSYKEWHSSYAIPPAPLCSNLHHQDFECIEGLKSKIHKQANIIYTEMEKLKRSIFDSRVLITNLHIHQMCPNFHIYFLSIVLNNLLFIRSIFNIKKKSHLYHFFLLFLVPS